MPQSDFSRVKQKIADECQAKTLCRRVADPIPQYAINLPIEKYGEGRRVCRPRFLRYYFRVSLD
jgi:hypothetical protein